MHVLVTRSEGDALALKSRLDELGCRVSLAPLIKIVPNAVSLSALDGATALVATSRNALKALTGSPALQRAKSLPLFVVGPGTAAIAREIGFSGITEGAGTAAGLVPTLKARAANETFVHLSGDVLSFDLVTALALQGVAIRRVTAYRSVPTRTLPLDVVKALRNRDIDAVVLMSPRTAEVWAHLANGAASPADLTAIIHLCLSQAVAEALTGSEAEKNVMIAARPNLEEMLALLKRLAAHSKAE
jgi:uroporphyrinogen-III synthase